ncbi:hypothetical protein ACVGXO_16225, partial [Enterobacter hormaechei]
GSANSFFIIPGVRVVFALRLLLPGGGGVSRPTKTNAPGHPPPPGRSRPVLFLGGALTIQFELFKKQKQILLIKIAAAHERRRVYKYGVGP